MKYSAVAIAAFVALASAQDVNSIPSCAIPCIDDAAAKASDCEAKDYKCICTNQADIVPAATTCVLAECGNAVALNEVLPATEAFCKAVLAGGGDDEPVVSTTEAPESSVTAPAETSSAAPVETSSAAEPEETTSAAPSVYPTATITTSVVPTESAEPSGTTSSSTTVATAGAVGVAGSFGLLLLGAAAAL